MRPLRLELSGFTAFREPVEVDFTDADLFALVGPTGSGKSSLIDAMCFACYGTVPRLDRRAVEPVISSGKQEARVRFDFSIAGRAYSAVRVVRRLKPGRATTKEARLESQGQVLAGDADAVTAKIEQVLGFGFEQFTKCVVLPQGDFAKFLHDRPAERQDLLVRLLDLGVYERMREAAQSRRVGAQSRRQVAERRLEDLADATDEALVKVEEQVTQLEALREKLDAAEPRIVELGAKVTAADQRAHDARGHAERLAAIEVPDAIPDLAATLADASSAKTRADKTMQAAVQAVERATSTLEGLGDKDQLSAWRDAHARRRDLLDRIAKGEPLVEEAQKAVERARTSLVEAEQAAGRAEEAVQGLRDEHAAAHLLDRLAVGEPCPVCAQHVAELPDRGPPGDLGQTEAALKGARKLCAEQTRALREAENHYTKLAERLDGLRIERDEVESRLKDAPDKDLVAARLDEFTTAEAALAVARENERTARNAARQAEEAVTGMRDRERQAWERFDQIRDTVAAMAPPPVDRTDLAGAWDAFATWAQKTAQEQQQASQAAQADAERLQTERRALEDELRGRCAKVGVEVGDRRPRDACADALAQADADRKRITKDLQTAAELRGEVEQAGEGEAIAEALARHLTATGFERWLLDEALDRLIDGAGGVLRELSDGQYSLAIDSQRNFTVIDHRNADEQRPAKTLSGGETFLASLALALTLAEHLAALAVATAPRLESIFLDEGFGSLDLDTLDVVASAIEELGATGRTVGIVTHVRELAERVPVRYEVRKGPSTSTVERVMR